MAATFRHVGPVRDAAWVWQAIVRAMLPPLLAALLWACGPGASLAQTDGRVSESKVKAALLYKFVHYVEWPPQAFTSPDSPLTIGVIGADALADELATVLANRLANGRPVLPRKLRRGDALTGLHMLFIGRSEGARVASLLSSASGQSVLTVTESDEAFALGSAINFVLVDDKVRFDVALRPAEQGNIKISARLLAVARKVAPNPS